MRNYYGRRGFLERMANGDEPLPIKSVGTTFAVVEAIGRHERASLDTLVAAVDASKSTVYKHLRTLTQLGYVEHDEGGYRLTDRFAAVSGAVEPPEEGWRTTAGSVLADLANTTGDVAGLLRLNGAQAVQVAQSRGDVLRRRGFTFQTSPHLHASAGGKVILADLPDARVASILDEMGTPALTEHTVTDRAALLEELEVVRDRGFAYEREEQAPGVRGIAAPVEWDGEGPAGALYVVGPTERMGDTRLEAGLPEILRAAVDRLEPLGDVDPPARAGLSIPKR